MEESSPSGVARSLTLAGVAALGAAAAWLISLPFLPLPHPVHDTKIADQYTLGTFFGWFNNALLGLFVCGLVAYLVTWFRRDGRNPLTSGLLAAGIGAAVVCGSDAFSDWMNIRLQEGGVSQLLLVFDWNVLIGLAVALSVAVACAPTSRRLTRALLAGLAAAMAGYVVEMVVGVFLVLILISKAGAAFDSLSGAGSAAPLWLVNNMVICAVTAVAIDVSVRTAGEVWLHLPMGQNETRRFLVDRPVTRLGYGEGNEVRLPNAPGLQRFHASIQKFQKGFWVRSDGGPVTVNGIPVDVCSLSEGDVIQVGSTTLEFSMRSRSPLAASGPTIAPPPQLAAVVVSAGAPAVVLPGGIVKDLAPGNNLLGRDDGSVAGMRSDESASRRHAEICVGQGVVLRDLGSTNGTFLNGQRISGEASLKDGDVIQVGRTQLVFRVSDGGGIET